MSMEQERTNKLVTQKKLGWVDMKFNKFALSELATIKYGKNQKKVLSESGNVPIYGTGGLMGYATTSLYDKPSVLIGRKGTIGKVKYVEHPFWTVDTLFYTIVNTDIVLPKYLYYVMSLIDLNNYNEGTTIPSLRTETLNRLEFDIPSLVEQETILSCLNPIDEKIALNNAINNNLEEQLSALFVNMFGHSIDSLDNSDIKLGDLIESVDNRGKTPPLSDEPTDYPIIDVRALSGNSRIIDYTNCTKYVSKETYNNWFRSGHPKEYDILISTVGSLAEMKIFLGTIGCIAQNVVGFRTKGISPLYLYQYLNYIKNDLVAYNIGSVQPSIKITHIIKHSIYVASKENIEIFDSIARNITKKIFANCQENEALKQMRDTLLPRLMSGKLDVSNIEI